MGCSSPAPVLSRFTKLAVGGIMAARPRAQRRRKAPTVKSVLDRRCLLQTLDERGLSLKPVHVTAFYQALHRQHYPDLPQFVENYYKHEQEREIPYDKRQRPEGVPLKNAVSYKKNKNKLQLPKKFLEFLKDPNSGLATLTSNVADQKISADGTTTKLAVKLHDGQLVESVLMRYVSPDGSRASLCVSSQCGCAMGCTFCATGTMGLSGNLSTGEILEQIVHADKILAKEWKEKHRLNVENVSEKANSLSSPKEEIHNHDLVRNVVFMGMGEPLDNYDNVVEACRALIDRKRWSLSHGKVCVSTVGIVSKIRRLTADLPEVSLALSLHAPNQEMRSAIVPTAKHYPIEDLINALDAHMMSYLKKRLPCGGEFSPEQRVQESARRRAMIEYVMLEGPTSSFECAHQLGKLCENRQLLVNLIPYNQTDVEDELHCPSEEHMLEFKRIVCSYGAFCTIRRTMGADIDSACGQLISKKKNKEKNTPHDIEDIGSSKLNPSSKSETSTTVAEDRPSYDAPVLSENGETSDLDRFVRPLLAATVVAATCFVASSYLFLRQRRR